MTDVLPEADHRTSHDAARGRSLPYAAALGASGLAAVGLTGYGAAQVELPVTSDAGLAADLPPAFWLGFLALNLTMLAALRRPQTPPALMVTLQAGLCFVVYGTPAVISDTPRTEVAWRHLGITRALTDSGSVDPTIDAYFNWPGFFAGLGGVIETTGIDPLTLALWAPVSNGLLWALGVACIVRALTKDNRHLWLALWFFTLTNWIDQDYLSSQAFAFFIYLVALALVMTMLEARPALPLRGLLRVRGALGGWRAWWAQRLPTEPSGRLRVTGFVLALVFCATIVMSHQLTPFVLLMSVGVLTVTGRTCSPRLGSGIALAIVLWLSTAASAYLAGHPLLFVESDGAVESNVAARLGGSPGHVLVVQVRTVMALACWSLAAVGFVRLWRQGVRDPRPAFLFAVPLAMVPVHPYGGEMMLRAALFASPFTAYFAAAALLPLCVTKTGRSILVGGLLAALAIGLVTARFGNTRFDMFTDAEIEGVAQLYELAPDDAVLIAGAHPTAWRHRDYTAHRHTTLTDLCQTELPASCDVLVRERASESEGGAMVLLSRGNLASMRMQGDATTQAFEAFEGRLASARDTQLVFRNEDVRIYRIVPQGQEGGDETER